MEVTQGNTDLNSKKSGHHTFPEVFGEEPNGLSLKVACQASSQDHGFYGENVFQITNRDGL